ncbi:MAG: family 16 glycoside hydrolase [Planctomycetia bacterium]
MVTPRAACLLLLLHLSTATPAARAEPTAANYDEAAVRSYTLPDVLAGPDGRPVASAEAWRTTARPHQFEQLERFVYGRRLPPVPVTVAGTVERADVMLPGDVPAVRLQATLKLGDAADAPTTEVLLYLPGLPAPSGAQPAAGRGFGSRVPVFLNLNFRGNHAEHADPAIRLSTRWMPDDRAAAIVDHRATEASRGTSGQRWPVESMLARGFGMATAYYGDVFPDRADGRPESALKSLGRPVTGTLPADEPGAIATWAWQLSRILDWLVTLPEVDPARVIVVGHSRLGKAALWAGACDERFAMVASNESGCGGAALSRRNYGETVDVITSRFPHWFCPAFATYARRETELPCDQHTLLAMTAPRPLYVASAVEDRWADPRGEFLSCVAAAPVWQLFGLVGLGTTDYPPIDTPIGQTIGYHVRTGRHDLIAYDWHRFADFADRTVRKQEPPPADGYPAFHPPQSPLPVKPPAGAVVLLPERVDATTDLTAFVGMAGGPIDWQVDDGTLVVQTTAEHANHIVSRMVFRDADIHAEFLTSPVAKGNSGLYLHGHYEMQIYDSFGVEPPTEQDEGGLYRFGKPIVNASRPVGEWQVYDVRFIAPRRDAAGTIVKPGSVTAWLNGKLVQNELRFTEPRSPYTPYKHGATDYLTGVEKKLLATGEGPLFLQDHESPTRFRNVWIKRLDTP